MPPMNPARSIQLSTFALASVLLVAPPSAVAGPVIEPTMEPVIRDLSRVPRGAPRGTEQAGSSVAQDHIKIAFLLPSEGRAVFRLDHPAHGPAAATIHGPFAMSSTLAPDHPLSLAFVAAMAKEASRFRWALAGSRDPLGSDPLGDARSALRMSAMSDVQSAVKTALELAAPDDIPTRRRCAALLMAAGFEDRARSLAEGALAHLAGKAKGEAAGLQGEGPSLLALLGRDYAGQAKEAFAGGPGAICALAPLADTLALLGKNDEAARWLDEILDAAPTCRAAHHQRCELYSLAKDWDGLLACARAGSRALPEDADFGVRQATALRGLGRYEEAIVHLEAAVRARPHASGPMSSLANLYTMTRTDSEKWAALDAACEAKPDDIVTCFLAGVLAHYLAKHEACVARMTSLLDALPKQPRVPMYAAISSFYLGRVPDADRLIARAAAISGAMDPDVYYCRSLIERDRDQASAIKDLERFLRVASRGWHSEGKIARVTGELALLRKGIIPPPAEAHHRAEGAEVPEGARSGGGDLASRPAEEPLPPEANAPQDPPSSPATSGMPMVVWYALALLGLGAGFFLTRRTDS
jgi:tetratricopeptide (TPR) repeat protein